MKRRTYHDLSEAEKKKFFEQRKELYINDLKKMGLPISKRNLLSRLHSDCISLIFVTYDSKVFFFHEYENYLK